MLLESLNIPLTNFSMINVGIKVFKMTSNKADINLDLDITRELAIHEEISGSTKKLTEFDATPPMYVTSIGRGQWPKPGPGEIRLPRAFYESKGLLVGINWFHVQCRCRVHYK